MKCEVSPLYSKDELKQLHFECNYCGKEMVHEEERDCEAEPKKCKCGGLLGNSNYSVSHCFECDNDI